MRARLRTSDARPVSDQLAGPWGATRVLGDSEPGGALDTGGVQSLQRALGNAAVCRLLESEDSPARSGRRASVRPGSGTKVLQRNDESALLLKDLAVPKVLEPKPAEVEVQTGIVTALEAAIAQQGQRVGEKRDALSTAQAESSAFGERLGTIMAEGIELSEAAEREIVREGAVIAEARDEAESKLKAEADRLSEWDRSVMCLGAIELVSLPASDADLLRTAKLIDLPTNSLGISSNFALVEQVGVKDAVVQNTLNTMVKAGQTAYLRKSGLIGPEWKVLIEIHYYRKRDQGVSEFHKDTLGQTLFVNLNYQTAHPISGPEYLVHPPTVPEHERQIAESLPPEFLGDLAAIRKDAEEPTEIGAPIIPAFGAVAFVDEAIHHMTPLRGHRQVEAADFARYLNATYPAEHTGQTPPTETLDTWRAMSQKRGTVYTRPDFRKAGMRNREIDKLLAQYGPSGFRTVTIPRATPHIGGSVDITRRNPVPLKRRMSWRARKGELPPAVAGERRFFRTWVRAVRRT
jgi:hypothetical protein